MLDKWKNLEVVEINKEEVPCRKCGGNLFDIFNVKYAGETWATPYYTKELCQCRSCDNLFVVIYNIYDHQGHIQSKVFRNDINDPTHNWQDTLTEEQLRLIKEHLKDCLVCRDVLDEEVLKDAWFASVFRKR